MKNIKNKVLISVCVLVSSFIYLHIALSANSVIPSQAHREITSMWGTAPVVFDTATGTLTVESGTLESHATSQFVDENNLILKSEVKSVVFLDNVIASADSSYLFSDNTGNGFDEFSYFWTNLTQVVGKLDVANVTNMEGMFFKAKNLTDLDISDWDVSNVKNMSKAFQVCNALKILDVSNWDVSKVESLNLTFAGLNNITTLDVGKWNTAHLTDMGGHL